jgi:hypothetical protein
MNNIDVDIYLGLPTKPRPSAADANTICHHATLAAGVATVTPVPACCCSNSLLKKYTQQMHAKSASPIIAEILAE